MVMEFFALNHRMAWIGRNLKVCSTNIKRSPVLATMKKMNSVSAKLKIVLSDEKAM